MKFNWQRGNKIMKREYPQNTDPFEPWNGFDRDNPFAPWNDPMKKDDPFACWNNPFGHGKYRDEV